MLTVRPISATDSIEELTQLLHRAYARLGAMGLNYTAVDQTSETTRRRIDGGQCYVAHWSARLAGTVVVQPTYATSECKYFTRPGVAAAHQFGVAPEFQGLGIGRALLLQCETWATEHGFLELAMDTAEQATHLIDLYGRLGYMHVGDVRWPGKVYRSVVLSKHLKSIDPRTQAC
jgi:GNAT superfamily N-acetyltransferase